MKIALVGIAGSGKDYLADFLVENHKYTRFAFADTLKKTVSEIFPYVKEYYPPETKELPLNIQLESGLLTKTPREMWLETSEFFRSYDELYFHNKSLQELVSYSSDHNIIITDLRMQVEFDDLSNMGYTIILVENPTNTYPLNDFDKQINAFKDNVDYTFINDEIGLNKFRDFYNKISITNI